MAAEQLRIEQRLLMVPLSVRDRQFTGRILEGNQIAFDFCSNFDELCEEIQRGVGVLLLHESHFTRFNASRLLAVLENQPPWSEIPVIYICEQTVTGPSWLGKIGNVSVLPPPLHAITLISVIGSSQTSRRRQYQVRTLLERDAAAQRDLVQADQRKDEFITTLAHELRNPISPILNSLELLRLSNTSLKDEHKLREIMFRQVRQLTRIVDDLLDVSRITRGKVSLTGVPLDIRESLIAAIESSKPFVDQSNQTLNVDLGDCELPVYGDAARLSQVLANLINNAAKYTPSGGSIWLTSKLKDDAVVISVRDSDSDSDSGSGIGIEPEKLGSVFELFEQHDVDKERGQAGLGIGLTLVQQFVELHEGSVEAYSEGKDQRLPFDFPVSTK